MSTSDRSNIGFVLKEEHFSAQDDSNNINKSEPETETSTETGAPVEDEEEEEEAEGGLHAWLTVIGSSLVYFATFGIVNSFGFFQDYYRAHFIVSVPPSTISFVGTIQITLMNLLAAPAGSLFDCYGLKVCSLRYPLYPYLTLCRHSTFPLA